MAGQSRENPGYMWKNSNNCFIDSQEIVAQVIEHVKGELRERADELRTVSHYDSSANTEMPSKLNEHYFPTVPVSEHHVLTGSFKHLLVHRRPKGGDSALMYDSAMERANESFVDDVYGED